MNSWIPPGFIYIIGAMILPFLKGKTKKITILAIPAVALLNLLMMTHGEQFIVQFLGYKLVFGRVDKLSMVFGYIFGITGFLGMLYSIHLEENRERISTLLYIGSSLGVVFAGDLITLFIFWEIMAFTSAFVIWARNNKKSYDAGFRYVLVHAFGGVCLLFGIILHIVQTGSTEFTYMGLHNLATALILLGFAINAAIPPFSAWLSDAYPEASVTGTVILSAFTTKTAVYVLVRSFPGTELLMWAGGIMSLYGIVYAILENDMRRVLAYSIINQVGFMITGIGIGTELALNGTVSHAFSHILYKALLLMSAGAVLYRTGISKCTELGGLFRSMPLTLICGCIGAAAISSFPLTNGFISKSMIIAASEHENKMAIWLMLELASAGVFLHAGIKFPWFVFFAKDSGLRPKDPPLPMILAMGIAAFLCIFYGIFYQPLYSILPFEVDFVPYTASRVVNQLQILLFSALAFFVMLKYLQRTPTISLDTDWIYRKGADFFLKIARNQIETFDKKFGEAYLNIITKPLLKFSENVWKYVDVDIVDGMVNHLAIFVENCGERVKSFQTGHVRNYALFMVIGMVLIFYILVR